MEANKVDVSIIVPVYNSQKTIRECIQSILNSEFDKDYEIIVVNDGSKDNSIEKIKDMNVKIISQDNKGAAAARNAGARISKSDLIIFVDSDVTFFKDTLKQIYNHLIKPDIHFVSGMYSLKPMNNGWIHKYKALADYAYYYDLIFTKEQKQRPIKQVVTSSGFEAYKKQTFERLGEFDERIRGADVEQEKLLAKLAKNYTMIADANIKIRHYFPDFLGLTKDYFMRTLHLIDVIAKHDYNPPHLKKNRSRVILGALVVISFIFSSATLIFFGYKLPFIIFVIALLLYLSAHLNMFVMAFRESGIFFMLFTIVTNLFFCCLISLAGLLGTVKIALK